MVYWLKLVIQVTVVKIVDTFFGYIGYNGYTLKHTGFIGLLFPGIKAEGGGRQKRLKTCLFLFLYYVIKIFEKTFNLVP